MVSAAGAGMVSGNAAAADRPVLLDIDRMTVTYASSRGPVTAVSSLSAKIHDGEFVSVLGPSGCGKSTLLGVVSGLLKPSAGQALLGGIPVKGPRPDVGVVFQRPTLLPWLTVMENVMVPVRTLKLPQKEYAARAEALIEMVGLHRFRNHYPNELSGGMQQRVGIARALVHDPKLLLMDEPFAALDAMTREKMSLELQRIWTDAKKTVLFITHSIPEAVFLSDRILVMSSSPGRVVEDIACDIPRPRNLDTLEEPSFAAACNRLRRLFDAIEVGAQH